MSGDVDMTGKLFTVNDQAWMLWPTLTYVQPGLHLPSSLHAWLSPLLQHVRNTTGMHGVLRVIHVNKCKNSCAASSQGIHLGSQCVIMKAVMIREQGFP